MKKCIIEAIVKKKAAKKHCKQIKKVKYGAQ